MKYILILLMLFIVGNVNLLAQNEYENYERAFLTPEEQAGVDGVEAMGGFRLPMPRHGGPLYVSYSKLERRHGSLRFRISACDSTSEMMKKKPYPYTFTFIDKNNDTTSFVIKDFDYDAKYLTFRKIKDEGEKFTIIVSSPNYKTRVFKDVLLVDNFAVSARLIPKDYVEPTPDKE